MLSQYTLSIFFIFFSKFKCFKSFGLKLPQFKKIHKSPSEQKAGRGHLSWITMKCKLEVTLVPLVTRTNVRTSRLAISSFFEPGAWFTRFCQRVSEKRRNNRYDYREMAIQVGTRLSFSLGRYCMCCFLRELLPRQTGSVPITATLAAVKRVEGTS